MEVYYRRTSHGIRVWDITWGGNTFEVFNEEEFAKFQELGKRLSIHFFEAED
jgi:hypothetical protein